MTRELEPDEVFEARKANMHKLIAETRAAIAFGELAHRLDEGDDLMWSARIYQPLEEMAPRDLALMVVLLLVDDATKDADRLWSAIHTMTPKDVR